jgi:tetratricopeptide (TPR) repeat protein
VPAHYALGNAYLATNQPAEALKAYQRAAQLDKNLTLALKGMGDALFKQGKTREATQYYNRAKVSGQPLPTNTGLTSARELKKRKKWAEAVREFEEIAKTEPSVDVFIDIGDCYVGLEQPLSASKAYQRATEVDPKAALAFFKYGEVMFKLREYAAAMEALERALALDLTGAQFNRQKARERANEAAKKLGVKNN